MPRVPTCHPDREHYAKGVCARCYKSAAHDPDMVRRWRAASKANRAAKGLDPHWHDSPKTVVARRGILIRAARRHARTDGLEFSLTADDVVIPDRCPVLGIPLDVNGANRADNLPS